MLQFLESLADRLTKVLLWMAGLAIFLMMVHVGLDIALKYFFSSPVPSTLEITTYYYMPLVALAPIAILQRERGHIVVELFTHSASKRLRSFLDGVMALLAAGFMGLMGWFSTIEAIRKTERGEFVFVTYFDLLVWPARWIVPVTAAVFVLVALLQALGDLAKAFGKPPAEAAS